MIEFHHDTVPIGYLSLIRKNRNFRQLWYGQLVSNLGDWFNLIASASLLAELTESGLAVGMLFVIRTLAPFLAGPFGGVIADRYNRRNIMLVTNLLKVPIIFAFLLVRNTEDVWLLYLLTALQLFLSGIFFPARSAMLPDVVAHNEIGTATAITGATFAAMLAIGSALGGFFSGMVGIYPAFVVNGLAYLLSAFFFTRILLDEPGAINVVGKTVTKIFAEYLDGLRYIKAHPYLFVLALHKVFGGLLLGSTFEVVQVAIAQTVFVMGSSGSSSMGLMFAISGVGLMLSTLVLPYFVKNHIPRLVWIITAGYLMYGCI